LTSSSEAANHHSLSFKHKKGSGAGKAFLEPVPPMRMNYDDR
jgi:hypothetical protein